MYKKGEKVVYGHTGICTIEDITHIEKYSDNDKNKLFYVLVPVNNSTCKIYIDVQSKKVILRNMISRQEADSLISSVSELEGKWIAGDKEREKFFKEEYKSCDPKRILGIVKSIYIRKLQNKTKKLNVSDSKILKQSEDYLYNELSTALDDTIENIKKLITEDIKNEFAEV